MVMVTRKDLEKEFVQKQSPIIPRHLQGYIAESSGVVFPVGGALQLIAVFVVGTVVGYLALLQIIKPHLAGALFVPLGIIAAVLVVKNIKAAYLRVRLTYLQVMDTSRYLSLLLRTMANPGVDPWEFFKSATVELRWLGFDTICDYIVPELSVRNVYRALINTQKNCYATVSLSGSRLFSECFVVFTTVLNNGFSVTSSSSWSGGLGVRPRFALFRVIKSNNMESLFSDHVEFVAQCEKRGFISQSVAVAEYFEQNNRITTSVLKSIRYWGFGFYDFLRHFGFLNPEVPKPVG
jgi:hypothetical protein